VRPALPSWFAVGGWFVPFANLVLPPLVFADLARRSVAPGGPRLRWLVWLWWPVYLLAGVAVAVGAALVDLRGLAGVRAALAARDLIAGVVRTTPLEPCRPVAATLGGPVWLKCEHLQRAGSFKIRGAYVRISRLSAEERARGVVAASAGNHAQGVALAAGLLGAPTTVFMPVGAPLPKIAATKGYGAAGRTADAAGVQPHDGRRYRGRLSGRPHVRAREQVRGRGRDGHRRGHLPGPAAPAGAVQAGGRTGRRGRRGGPAGRGGAGRT